MADKRVIVLEHEADRFRVALWALVPTERRPFFVKDPEWKSAWSGADATELAKLRSGEWTERVEEYARQGASNALAQADLQSLWQDFQNEITNRNPWNRYGTVWDGTAWTPGGVA